MTHRLPPHLLQFFAPRPPLQYLRPPGRDPGLPLKSRARAPPALGLAETLGYVQENSLLGTARPEPGPEPGTSAGTLQAQFEERERLRKAARKQEERDYRPLDNANATSDAFKTLFVARLPKDIDEEDLGAIFGRFGPIADVKLARDRRGRFRGYAFVMFNSEADLKVAVAEGDGFRIHGQRLVIDVERGRTTRGWKPRRLGGGLTLKKRDPPTQRGPRRFRRR